MTPSQDLPPHKTPHPPDLEQIIARLERFRPNPGPRLQARLATAPWAPSVSPAGRERSPVSWRKRFFAIAAALGILLLGVALFSTPPGRAAAAQLARFFQRSESDFARLTLQLPLAQGAQESFPLSLEQAATQAGYPVWRPGRAPAELLFNGARYDPALKMVIQDYSSATRQEVLRISQTTLGEYDQFTRIGGSAQVEQVRLEGATAEYVSGSWKIEQLPPIAEGAPAAEVEVTATWDAAAHVQLLRWRSAGYQFEILHVSGKGPISETFSRDTLADLASGLSP